MIQSYWLGVAFAVIILVAIFLRLRNSGMKERYATWWIVIAIASVVFSIFPGPLHSLAHLLGVQVPLNLAFFAAGVVMLLLTLRFSVDLSQAGEERRRLVEEIAILSADIDALKADVDSLRASRDEGGPEHD